ncbi:hypothetical protein HRbin02_01960 [Candidatus Calditenuaceae archaeon HR02]|nr:hypothetical protein HRbin02_01960 [Candidatus Calditenuaceae archaeon HR02]
MTDDLPLNTFQSEALRQIMQGRVGVVQMPTGTGKSRLAAAAVRKFIENGVLARGDTVLVLTPRVVIREQLLREFDNILEGLCVLVDVKNGTELDRWQIGRDSPLVLYMTPQLLHRHGKTVLGRFAIKGVILDEVHHTSTGDEIAATIRMTKDVAVERGGFAIGLTATPTIDALELLNERLLYHTFSAEAMLSGVLIDKLTLRYAHTTFDAPSDIDPWIYAVPQRAKEYGRKIVEELNRDVSVKALVVAANIREAGWLREHILEQLGNDYAEFVRVAHYQVEDAVREMEWFRSTNRGILITVNMADIGFDVPDLEILILARRFKSPISYTQVRGRVLRRPGDTEAGRRKRERGALLIDLTGCCMEHEPKVPQVESGALVEESRSLTSELRGAHQPRVITLGTKVTEFTKLVIDAKAIKNVEQDIMEVLSTIHYGLSTEKIIEEIQNSKGLEVFGPAFFPVVERMCANLQKSDIIIKKEGGVWYLPREVAILWHAAGKSMRPSEYGIKTFKMDYLKQMLRTTEPYLTLQRYGILEIHGNELVIRLFGDIPTLARYIKLSAEIEKIKNRYQRLLARIENICKKEYNNLPELYNSIDEYPKKKLLKQIRTNGRFYFISADEQKGEAIADELKKFLQVRLGVPIVISHRKLPSDSTIETVAREIENFAKGVEGTIQKYLKLSVELRLQPLAGILEIEKWLSSRHQGLKNLIREYTCYGIEIAGTEQGCAAS